MKIVVLDGYPFNPGDLSWDELNHIGELTVYERTKPDQVIKRIGDAEVVLTNKVQIDKKTINACKHIRFIGVLATGYNIIDIPAATAAHITVCNVPTYSTDSVAQFVFALLLNICHKVELHNTSVKAGDWQNCADFGYWKFPLVELVGKTMGLIGYGKISKRTAQLALAFGMKVIVYHHKTKAGMQRDGVQFVALDTLFKLSDVISLHVPLFDSTKHIINHSAIQKMKDGVILINTSRGELLDEKAVTEALNSKKIGYLAADVVSVEPILASNPLLKAPNAILTPHIAWAPYEARVRLMSITLDNLKQFLAGHPVNQVNA